MDDIKKLFSTLMTSEGADHQKLYDTYESYLNSQPSLLEHFKDNVSKTNMLINKKPADSDENATDSILMILLLFEQSLGYKRLAEKLMDDLIK